MEFRRGTECILPPKAGSECGRGLNEVIMGQSEHTRETVNLERLQKENDRLRKLLHSSGIDALTTLWNKVTLFGSIFETASSHPEERYVFVRWDVNNFHLINEIYGTQEGDRVLKQLAHQFDAMERQEGRALYWGYMGNDSFAACYLRKDFDAARFQGLIGSAFAEIEAKYNFTISIGMCEFAGREADNSIADKSLMALRSILNTSQNSYAWYDDSFRERAREAQELTGEMMAALRGGDFVPFFQPQYTCYANERKELCGAEALIRWQHPTKGLISPGIFLPLFEKNGFIWDIDWFVWESTVRYIRQWLDQGYHVPRISVNISRADVFHTDLVQNLLSLAGGYGVSPEYLGFEITASAYTEMDRLREVTDGLREAGFRVVMDDFGDTSASLDLLRDVPVDQIKIDMRFIRGDEDRARTIVKNIVATIREIGSEVIAEGVETKEVADFLRYIGCRNEQGYYFARPMPEEDFEKLLISQ